jgi:DNA repair protein RecO (recombination protein O)
MAGSLKTEAIVLRSLRYGEADRILHLYSPDRGKIGAIAKGARKARSRFGGRLEPMMRLRLVLHEGRSDLLTVTSVETLAAYPRLREDGAAIDSAARSCDAVARMFGDAEPAPAVFHLLANQLALLNADASRYAGVAPQLSFRLKLLVAAGLTPQLARCANCGAADELVGFSGAAGGVVCASCEAASFPLTAEAHGFLVDALASPLSDAPLLTDATVLRLAERAITETAEHHAHVRLRSAVKS